MIKSVRFQNTGVENKFFPTMPMDERLDQFAAIQLVVPVGVVHLNKRKNL